MVRYFSSCRNIIPVVSIEGDKNQTDNRRGEGVFERISLSLDLLKKRNIFYGISITVTSDNFDSVLDEGYIRSYIDRGCKAFFFIEYVPFVPYSDVSLKNLTLKEALSSSLLNEIRSLHGLLQEHKGGCTLFENKDIVESHLKNTTYK